MEVVVNQSNFEQEVLKSDLPVLIDFWAPWCGPCRMMAPIVEELSVEMSGKAKVAKINVDENQELAMQYNVMSIPTFLVFKGGAVVDQLVGGMEKDQLKKRVARHAA